MLDFTDISIDDRALFDRHLSMYNPQASELTFTNLFMWRSFYKIRYAEICGLLCIVATPDDKEPFAFVPVGEITSEAFREAVALLREYFFKKGWRLKFERVAESELPYFEEYMASGGSAVLDPDSSDYVYLTDNLVNLKGKKYDGKRNHINKFRSRHEFEYVVLDDSHVDECSRIVSDWCAERDCSSHAGLYCEKIANMELLSNYGKLGAKGALIKVDGRFEAFTAGELLNDNTAVIHIEKANSKINGLYSFINQRFCENTWRDTTYINREQDLGMEGLRKAKLSYHPAKLVNKYIVYI